MPIENQQMTWLQHLEQKDERIDAHKNITVHGLAAVLSKIKASLMLCIVYRVSQNDRINSAQLDSSLGVHKNCPKKRSCMIHSF
ncbi:hypothetical protein TNCV_4406741 [Trichonephila clavipes]|nr:hypothetical protein TNCV_4406741 [Trichonephila clavipes]